MSDESATPAASAPHGRFVWHDLKTTDPDAAKAFYGALFDWDIQDVPMEHGTYRMITAGEEGQGGIEAVPHESVPPHWLGYVTVADVDATTSEARNRGGQVHAEPMDIPGVGRFSVIGDPSGAVLAPFRSASGDLPDPAAMPTAGQFCWDELLSNDAAACEGFYPGVFAWHHTSMTMPSGPDMPDFTYHIFKRGTGEDAKDGAGMLQMPPGVEAPSHWLPYVFVDDVDATCAKAVELGGTVCKEADDIPNIGRFAVLIDPQGAVFALFKGLSPGRLGRRGSVPAAAPMLGRVKVPAPRYCRRAAYEAFAACLPALADTRALVGAATALAMHALDDVHTGAVEERLDAIAVTVRRERSSDSRRATIAHLHHALFDRERFEGNQLDYYDPANSYLPTVLASRRGIPISLALVYKAVAERLELPVEGLGAPGHFLVRIADESGPLIVDPFHKGRVLSEEEAFKLMESTLGAQVPRAPELLQPVTHAEWLMRMLRNLEAIHARRAKPRDAAAMAELRQLVELAV